MIAMHDPGEVAAKRFYTGIGSRTTPEEIQCFMEQSAAILERHGFVLRSGGAPGADKAFERGVVEAKNKQILRPRHTTPEAEVIAEKIHPAWHNCDEPARKLHGRNVMQVLGEDLKTPSEFVVCWTPDAKDIGGTRTAIVVARERGIKLYNLADPNDYREFQARVSQEVVNSGS